MKRNTQLASILGLLLLAPFVGSAQTKRIREVQVIKFDNYDNVDGEQKIFNHAYPKDTTESVLRFDIPFSVKNFSFPPANDTLNKLISGKKTPAFKPAEYDTRKRLTHYYRNAKEHYEFEYNSFGNLQYIKRWGAKHVTAQITFIYVYY